MITVGVGATVDGVVVEAIMYRKLDSTCGADGETIDSGAAWMER
jgi:hypothetical protein